MYERLEKRLGRIPLLLVALVIMILPLGKVFAQQEPHFTQYMFNRLFYNPAYAGSNGSICLTGFYRNQWMGFGRQNPTNGETESAPIENINVTFDMPVNFLHGGIGATIITDKIASWNNTYIKLDYAYRIQLPKGTLSFGAEVQLLNLSNEATYLGSDDGTNSTSDPVLRDAANANDFLFDIGFGAYYLIPGKFYAGFSSSRILQSESEKLSYTNNRIYNFTAGYEWVLPMYPSLKIMPSALFRHDFKSRDSWQLYGSVLVEYENKVWGGLGARMNDAVSVLAGFNVKNFKIGVAYDIPTSRLAATTNGSVELMLRYCFKIENPPKPNTIYGNTRY
ncbi:MAG: type IX secretion system membrane protein PorP/SprF [Bacteroidales bacterium]|jgi:type IX secretion system PorP/SprF family membrane protein|nr:type IX secretion system membrane protein PorP/SprF [Bacteroidales bacterium]